MLDIYHTYDIIVTVKKFALQRREKSSMSKNFEISVLLDYYGGMLTEKQREVLELYYNEDLSLSEIGENTGVTRQGVRDAIKRGEAILLELEEKVGYVRSQLDISERLEKIRRLSNEIAAYNDKYCYSRDIDERVKSVIKLTEQSIQ